MRDARVFILFSLLSIFSFIFLNQMAYPNISQNGEPDIRVEPSSITFIKKSSSYFFSTVSDIERQGIINPEPNLSIAPQEILVKFKPGFLKTKPSLVNGVISVSDPSINSVFFTLEIRQMKGVFLSTRSPLGDIYRLQYTGSFTPWEAIKNILKNPNVEWAEPNYRIPIDVFPNDYNPSQQWGLARIQADMAWDICQGSESIVIAIIDTGVDYNHPDLAGNIWQNPGEIPGNNVDDDKNGYVDDIIGWDFVSVVEGGAPGEDMGPPDPDPMDYHGHGTHCSGIASAVTNNGIGIAGTGWKCKIMALRAGYKQSNGNGILDSTDCANALVYAADNHARIISMSWGSQSMINVLQTAIEYAYNAGCVLVASAGNNQTNTKQYPAAFNGVIAVAASDTNNKRAWFSNYGDWVDIAAPGTDIYSTFFDDSYAFKSGTSMSSPFVAGVAGLVLSLDPTLTANDVTQRLIESGDDNNWDNPPAKILNAYQALSYGKAFNVYNDGNVVLNVGNIQIENGSPWLRTNLTQFTVAPGNHQSVIVSVALKDLEVGDYNDRLLIYSDDPDENPYPDGVNITLVYENTPPIITTLIAEPNTINEEEISKVTAIAWDPDKQILNYSWQSSGGTITGSGNEVIFIPPDISEKTTYVITVTVSDGYGGSDTSSVEIIVGPINEPPVVGDIPDISFPEGGSNSDIDLDDYVSDPDTPDSDISWTYIGNTNIIISINSTSHIVTFTSKPGWAGSEIITFTARDPGGKSASDSMKVTVTPIWSINFTIASTSQNPDLLSLKEFAPIKTIIGVHPNADDGFDPLDIPFPPIGPAPVLDAFIEGKNPFPRLSRDYRKEIPHNLFDQTWYLRAYTENYENAGFTICWDCINFPDDLSVFITPVDDTGKAIGPSIDIKRRLCFAEAFVAGKSHRFRIRASQTQCITLNLKAGWNMNSCPGDPAIKDVATLVANTSVLPYIYSWEPVASAYVMVSEIEFGKGYWFAAIEDTQLNICYFPKSSLSQLVKAGWNMVGSLSCSFSVSKLPFISLPADAILTYVYTWNSANGNTYILVDNIEPGIGYWVGALDDALLNMNCAQLAPIRQIKPLYKVQVPSWESVLEIQIGSFIQQLTFGMHPSASSGFDKAFDVPIPPTLGMFNNSLKAHWNIQDEYFSNLSSSYIKDEPHGIWELSIELSEPGIVRWRNLPQSYSCILKWHSQIIRMQPENSLELPSGKHFIKLEVDSLKTRPEKTQLSANYPNPCNPETWIPYCLSEDSEVNIIIHDVSGREVRRIYMGNQLAGRYEDKERAAYWDGKNERGEIVSSGIYFYTLKTAGVSQTRKMTMIR